MEQHHSEMAAQAMRIIAAFDGRTLDEFEIRALAMVMAKHPKLEFLDYEEAIVNYHQQPRPRMRAGHVIEGAKREWEKRTGARMLAVGDNRGKSPKPANYDEMVRGFTRIVEDFKAQGIDPTNEDILKENARRVREAEGN